MEPTTPQVSVPTPQPVSEPVKSSGSKRIPILLIIILIFIVLAGGGYFYMNNQQKAAQRAAEIKQSSEEFTNLENELSNESEGSESADFQTLEKDLQTL